MISVKEARKILSEHLERAEIRSVSLNKCYGNILAEDIYSPIDVPSFDNSAMDGYALKYDGQTREWELDGLIQAGDTSAKKLEKGKASRIFTGAKIPEGADTVIQQELIARQENSNVVKYDGSTLTKGSNIRLKGSQCEKAELILKKGTRITPGVVGLLASVGIAEVNIFSAPSVAYIITGDEIKEAGMPVKEGEIYNSNGPMLEAMLNSVGVKIISAYKARDQKEELQETINDALRKNDIIVLSGGISVGDYDYVRECLQTAGVKELFYKIKQKPGKPMYVGKKDKKLVFALPGNPASVLSCFNQYVKPCLRYIMGEEEVWNPDKVLNLVQDQLKSSGLTFFLKARVEENILTILKGQQSFNLQAFSTANCLVELAEEEEMVKAGTAVNIYNL